MKLTKIFLTGASSGVGRAFLQTLEQPAEVLSFGRRSPQTESAGKVRHWDFASVDFAEPMSLQGAIETWRSKLEAVDVAVLAAGAILPKGSFQDRDPQAVESNLATNLLSVLALARPLLHGMSQRGRGDLIILGSVSGDYPHAGAAEYCAAKAALVGFVDALAGDLVGTDVRVTLLSPGLIDTPLLASRFDSETVQKMRQRYPLLQAEDVARVIHWILSQPPYVNLRHVTVFPTRQAPQAIQSKHV